MKTRPAECEIDPLSGLNLDIANEHAVCTAWKEKKPDVYIAGIEPEGSPFISKGRSGSHKIQGIGPGFKPQTLDLSLLDEVMTIEDEEALSVMKWLHKKWTW